MHLVATNGDTGVVCFTQERPTNGLFHIKINLTHWKKWCFGKIFELKVLFPSLHIWTKRLSYKVRSEQLSAQRVREVRRKKGPEWAMKLTILPRLLHFSILCILRKVPTKDGRGVGTSSRVMVDVKGSGGKRNIRGYFSQSKCLLSLTLSAHSFFVFLLPYFIAWIRVIMVVRKGNWLCGKKKKWCQKYLLLLLCRLQLRTVEFRYNDSRYNDNSRYNDTIF